MKQSITRTGGQACSSIRSLQRHVPLSDIKQSDIMSTCAVNAGKFVYWLDTYARRAICIQSLVSCSQRFDSCLPVQFVSQTIQFVHTEMSIFQDFKSWEMPLFAFSDSILFRQHPLVYLFWRFPFHFLGVTICSGADLFSCYTSWSQLVTFCLVHVLMHPLIHLFCKSPTFV